MVLLHDPHTLLGLHKTQTGSLIRLLRPGALNVYLEVFGEIREAEREERPDLFTFSLEKEIGFADYRIYHPSGLLSHDPYAFPSTVGEMDLFLFNKGCHYELHSMLGAVVKEFQGIQGVQFSVWAPNATAVALVADFNGWNGLANPMRSLGVSGVWTVPPVTA